MAGYLAQIEQAESQIETFSVEQARGLLEDPDTVFVDVRDIRELWREGKIPGAVHAPRGMLEFWIDPDSPYYRPIFTPGKRFLFYCNKGWRSALATQTVQAMGLQPGAHIGGGFSAWIAAGAPVEPVERR